MKYILPTIGAVAATAIFAFSTSNQTAIAVERPSYDETFQQLELFADVLARVRSDYVVDVNDGELIEDAINGMLQSLDPHSSYVTPDAFRDLQVSTSGEYGGLGMEVTTEEGFVKVVSPIDGTPAYEAGIEAGDFITGVDGESLLGLTLDEAVELMRGPVGSEIIITVVREGAEQPFDVSIIRDTIKLTAVRSRVEGETVVLRVVTFSDQTYPSLEEQLAEQVAEAGGIENVNGFVIDLRNNPGGLLNQAIAVSDAFLDAGEIVSTRGRLPSDGQRWNAREGDLAEGLPIVVLINGGSASASEIVAGALQDHRRAIVIGTNSFGKGSVQTVMPLRGDSAMRLTTARYYTPSGRSIQSLGISPDIIVEQPRRDPSVEEEAEEERATRSEADLRGALDNDSLTDDEVQQIEADRMRAEDAAALREEDYQLAYAIDILKGLSALGPSASE